MFAKMGQYKAVGLFSDAHIISIFVCFIFVFLAVVFTRKMTKQTYLLLTKIFAIFITTLEIIKIVWSLANGYNSIDSYMPLYFCSLFIYALWFASLKNIYIKNLGLSFIAYACILAGAVFIVCPTSTFRNYPIFHFMCLYSMIYHSFMLYMGIMIFVTQIFKINFKTMLYYLEFCSIFMLVAILINVNFSSNLMFFSNPNVIPLHFLKNIYGYSSILYTAIMVFAHLLIGPFMLLMAKLSKSIYKSKK